MHLKFHLLTKTSPFPDLLVHCLVVSFMKPLYWYTVYTCMYAAFTPCCTCSMHDTNKAVLNRKIAAALFMIESAVSFERPPIELAVENLSLNVPLFFCDSLDLAAKFTAVETQPRWQF